MLAFGQAGLSTSRCNCLVDHFGVTKSVNNGLCNKNFVTYGAVLAFGQAGLSTSRCNCLVNYFGMTKCFHLFLRNKNLVTYGTVLALGQAGFGTSGRLSLVNYFGMTKCFHLFLRNKNLVTYGTMLTFGLTGIFAVGSDCSVNHFSVPRCRTNLGFYQNHATDRALGPRSRARLGTGRILCQKSCFGMSYSGNHLLLNQNRITYRAMLTLGQAGCGTGCTNSRINNLGVVCLIGPAIYVRIAATGAGVRGIAACGTGRRGDNRLVAMAGCLQFFVSGVGACRAVLVCIPTIVSTSGSLCRNLRYRMTVCRNLLRITVRAVTARKGLHTLVRTRRLGGHLCGIAVPLRRSRLRLLSNGFAVRALLACCHTALGTGCLNRGNRNLFVIVLAEQIAAYGTVTIRALGMCSSDGFRVGMVAVAAGEGLNARFGTSGLLGYLARIGVSGSCYRISNVRITAICTRVGRIALCGTSGSRDSSTVIVSLGLSLGVCVRMAAGRAGMRGVTARRTGRCGHCSAIAVAKRCHLIARIRQSARASVGRISRFGTCRSGYTLLIGVLMRLRYVEAIVSLLFPVDPYSHRLGVLAQRIPLGVDLVCVVADSARLVASRTVETTAGDQTNLCIRAAIQCIIAAIGACGNSNNTFADLINLR